MTTIIIVVVGNGGLVYWKEEYNYTAKNIVTMTYNEKLKYTAKPVKIHCRVFI